MNMGFILRWKLRPGGMNMEASIFVMVVALITAKNTPKKLYSNKLDLICVVSFWWMESFIAVLLNRDTVFIHLGWDTTTEALRCP